MFLCLVFRHRIFLIVVFVRMVYFGESSILYFDFLFGSSCEYFLFCPTPSELKFQSLLGDDACGDGGCR